MSDDTQKLEILVGLYELAISRLFETVPEGSEAKRLFVEDVRQLLDNTNEVQAHSPAAQTYEALLRRLGAAPPDAAGGLGLYQRPSKAFHHQAQASRRTGRRITWRPRSRASICAYPNSPSQPTSALRMASRASSRYRGRTTRLVAASRPGRACPGKARRHLRLILRASTSLVSACEEVTRGNPGSRT
jgi:hypothetical protein